MDQTTGKEITVHIAQGGISKALGGSSIGVLGVSLTAAVILSGTMCYTQRSKCWLLCFVEFGTILGRV